MLDRFSIIIAAHFLPCQVKGQNWDTDQVALVESDREEVLSTQLSAYDMFISTLTPGLLSAEMIANVEMLSTKVAINPPCRVPPTFNCDSFTVISQTHCPWEEDINCTYREIKEVVHQKAISALTYRF